MKATLLLTLCALCLLNSGCTLCHNLSQTAVVQPIQYWSYWDEMLERHRFRKIAELELERARSMARAESDNYSCPPFSIDHERGFVDGFVDFLVYGGTGNPPPLPPRRYWWSDCQKLDGCNAIQDWFRGFEHGVAVAQASGYRDCVTVPLSDLLIGDTLPLYDGQLSYTEYAEPVPANWESWPQDDSLPVLNSSDSSGTAPSDGTDATSLSPPQSSTGDDPDEAVIRKFPQRLPAVSIRPAQGRLPPSTSTPWKTSGSPIGLRSFGEYFVPALTTPATAKQTESPSGPDTRSVSAATLLTPRISQPYASAERSVATGLVSPPVLRRFETPGFASHPALIERTKPLSAIRDLPDQSQSPSIPAPRIAPMQRISPK